MPFMPFQIVGIWLRGLLALAILAGGIALIRRWDDDRHVTVYLPMGHANPPDFPRASHVETIPLGFNLPTAELLGGISLLALGLGGGWVAYPLLRRTGKDDPKEDRTGEVRKLKRPGRVRAARRDVRPGRRPADRPDPRLGRQQHRVVLRQARPGQGPSPDRLGPARPRQVDPAGQQRLPIGEPRRRPRRRGAAGRRGPAAAARPQHRRHDHADLLPDPRRGPRPSRRPAWSSSTRPTPTRSRRPRIGRCGRPSRGRSWCRSAT